MIRKITKSEHPDIHSVESFATRLEAYASSLSEREREILMAFIVSTMDPLERLRWTKSEGLLSAEEEALVEALAGEQQEQEIR